MGQEWKEVRNAASLQAKIYISPLQRILSE